MPESPAPRLQRLDLPGRLVEIEAATDGAAVPECGRIGPIAPGERDRAIARLVGRGGTAASRLAARFDRGLLDLRWCWAVRGPQERLEAVVLASINPGRTATLLLSPIQNDLHLRSTVSAIAGLCTGLMGTGAAEPVVDLVQTMLEPGASNEIEAVRRAGLQPLASLRFMDLLPTGRPTGAPAWPPDCSIERWTPQHRSEVASLLRGTYENTLDCPGLGGLRRVEDVLDGHLGAGRFEPCLWSFLRCGDTLAGLALLTPNPDADCTELVYFGVVPAIRGRGLAARLLQHALALDRRFPRVVLAVDERNLPALRLYRRAGFEPGAVRRAFIASRAALAAAAIFTESTPHS